MAIEEALCCDVWVTGAGVDESPEAVRTPGSVVAEPPQAASAMATAADQEAERPFGRAGGGGWVGLGMLPATSPFRGRV